MTLPQAFRKVLTGLPLPYWLEEVIEWVVIAAAVIGLVVLAVIA